MVVSEKTANYEFGSCRLDIQNRRLTNDGKQVDLAQKTFEILCYFVQNAGQVLKKEDLLNIFWEEEYLEETNLAQQIYRIRKAIQNEQTNDNYIETIRKYGYRFTANVKEVYEQENLLNQADISNDFESHIDLNNSYKTSNGFKNYQKKIDKKQAQDKEIKKDSWLNKNRTAFYIFGAIILAIVGLMYFSFGNKNEFSDIDSIAILPFNQIGENQDEKLGLGLADTLISKFSEQNEISVMPTSSIIKYNNSKADNLIEIGEKLNVDAVLTGTVQINNKTARVNLQLVGIKKKTAIWTSKFDDSFSDIFSLQDKISEQVTKKLLPLLAVSFKDSPYVEQTKNLEAFIAYSKGLAFWDMHTETSFKKAIRQFEIAIERDPKFALAYAYLADSYGHLIDYKREFPSKIANYAENGKEAAFKALELNSQSSEAMAALAYIYANTEKGAQALELMEKSIEIKSNDAHFLNRLSWMYANSGQIDKAVESIKMANKIEPKSLYLKMFLAKMLIYANKPDEAIEQLNKVKELHPKHFMAEWHILLAYEQKKEFDKAEKSLKSLLEAGYNVKHSLSRVYAKNGKEDLAKELLNKILEEDKGDENIYETALIYAALGEDEKTLERLNKIMPTLGGLFYTVKYDFRLDPIRKNPDFIKMMKEKEQQYALGFADK